MVSPFTTQLNMDMQDPSAESSEIAKEEQL